MVALIELMSDRATDPLPTRTPPWSHRWWHSPMSSLSLFLHREVVVQRIRQLAPPSGDRRAVDL